MKNLLVFLLIALASCTNKGKKKDVEILLDRYSSFIKSNKPDSIASLYALDGKLSGEGQRAITSPDSIRNFLKGFAYFNVLEYKFTSDSIFFKQDSAFATGSYFQKVIIPAGDTLELGGEFSCKLVYMKGWFIKNLYTFNYRDLKHLKL